MRSSTLLAWASSILLAATPTALLAAATDTDGDGIPDQLETSPFHVIPGEFTYQEAKNDAARRGGRLASFTDSTEFNGAKASMVVWTQDVQEGATPRLVPYPIWIGLEKAATWAWADGSSTAFLGTNWAAGEPSADVSRTRGGLNSTQKWQAFNPAQISGYLLELPATNPNSKDSDGDGASDYTELFSFHTNPNVANFGMATPLASVDFTSSLVNGSYEGLLANLTQGLTSSLTLKVTSKGAFSGSLVGSSGKASVKGTFATNGTASVTVKLGGNLVSYLKLVIAPDAVSGIYRVGASFSASPDGSNPTMVGELRRPIYSKTAPYPYPASYTIVLPAPATPKTGQPGGDGFLIGSLKSDGKATFTGLTSDGQALKWSGNLLEGEVLAFFSAFAKGKGFADGYLSMRQTADIDPVDGLVSEADLDGEVYIRRDGSAGSSASYAFTSNAYGSLYRNAPYNMLNSFADFTTGADNSILDFIAGPFSGQEVVTTWATNNKWSLPETQTRKLSGGINSKNGELTANYRYSEFIETYASSNSKLKGVILQKSGEVRGNYNMGAGFSGRIQLLPNYDGLVAPVNIISPRSKSIGPQGGSYKIYITSSEAWDAVITYDYSPYPVASDWLTLSEESGTGDGTITVTVEENGAYYPRSAKIKIAGITHTINQKQAIYDPYGGGDGSGGGGTVSDVVIDPVTRVVDTLTNVYQVTVTGYDPDKSANPALDFVSPVSWATVVYAPGDPLEDGTPTGVATVTVDYNPYFFNRTTQLTIGGIQHTLTQLWY